MEYLHMAKIRTRALLPSLSAGHPKRHVDATKSGHMWVPSQWYPLELGWFDTRTGFCFLTRIPPPPCLWTWCHLLPGGRSLALARRTQGNVCTASNSALSHYPTTCCSFSFWHSHISMYIYTSCNLPALVKISRKMSLFSEWFTKQKIIHSW